MGAVSMKLFLLFTLTTPKIQSRFIGIQGAKAKTPTGSLTQYHKNTRLFNLPPRT